MELDLFDILSEKEEGTRLYSPICGDLLLHNVSLNGVFCKQPGVKTEKNFVFMSDGHLKNYGEWVDVESVCYSQTKKCVIGISIAGNVAMLL